MPDASSSSNPRPAGSGLSRREVLAAVPAGVVLGLGGKALADTGASAPQRPLPLRAIQGVYAPPALHWVGDGFHVAGYFSQVPDALRRLDPFVLLDYHAESTFPPTTRRRGIGPHPHRGFETVTFAFQGSVAHHDSTGAGGVIGPGDVQWMTAGSGILHKEYHDDSYARKGGPFQMAQLWVNLPSARKWSPPRYQPIVAGQMGVAALPGGAGDVRVVAGEHLGAKGPATTHTPMTILDLRLEAGAGHELSFPAGWTTAVLVMAGAVALQEQKIARTNDFVLFDPAGGRISLGTRAGTRLLVLAGEPIGEPVVQYGPFVMNTQAEIEQAYTDYRAGKFGRLDD